MTTDSLSENSNVRLCPTCGAKLVPYFYPRPGPAPGFMLVCSDDRCEGSLAAHKRRMDRMIHGFSVTGPQGERIDPTELEAD